VQVVRIDQGAVHIEQRRRYRTIALLTSHGYPSYPHEKRQTEDGDVHAANETAGVRRQVGQVAREPPSGEALNEHITGANWPAAE